MTDPSAAKPKPSPIARRLTRLVTMARAADLWERAWRGLVPPLVVVGLFLCVSWLGLWLEVPHWARGVGVGVFGMALVLSCFGLLRLAPLSAGEALRRIDRSSGLVHRPASALADTPVTAGRDPATDALWMLHQRRAEAEAAQLKAGRPSPRVPELDRYAIRAGVVVALIACALVAGPQRYARVAAAFDFGTGVAEGPGYRLDAWIDPPPYTGRPPVLLDLATASRHDREHPQKLAVPAGSIVVVRSSGGSPVEIETSGPLLAPQKPAGDASADKAADKGAGKAAKLDSKFDPARQTDRSTPANPGDHEARLVLHGDSRLYLRHAGVLRGAFELTAIADRPPTIALREVPKNNVRGSLTLSYTVEDDYGVAKAEAGFANPTVDGESFAGPSLVPAPKVELSLPSMSNGIGDADTTADLSEHPWAGARVTMTMVARDEGGNEGRSEPVEILLPQKPFTNPLSRALVEQRRILVLDPGQRRNVLTALDGLMADPAAVGTTPSVYLGLRFAAASLSRARSNKQLVEVADFLWGMALQLENGDLSDAEKALRQAEKELRDAIDRKASDEEIQKLTQNLQAAMDKFLKELAEQQKNDKQSAQAQSGKGKSISPKDLQKLLDRLREQARSGNREEAKKALDELQDILENLKTAKRGKPDPQARAMAEGLNQLDQAMRDQQDLRDDTFKQGRQGQDQGQEQQGQQGQKGQDQNGNSGDQGDQGMQMPQGGQGSGSGRDQPGRQQGNRGAQPNGDGDPQGQGQQGGRGHQGPPKGFGERQRELRDRLAEIQKRLKQAGEGQGDLDEAGKAMREAEQALRQGEEGQSDAVDAQSRALDAMRKGAKKLAESLQQQNDPNGQSNAENEQQGQQGQQEGQMNSQSDPLGRRRGRSIDSNARFNPMGIPAAQRAQRVLEELRRRLGDPTRSQEEIEYLERLLRSY